LGKPVDAADAARTLALLAGQTHRVITAVAIGWGDDPIEQALAVSTSTVRFLPLSDAQIDAYVASGEPFGKAGAYAIQSQAAAWIARIAGSYSGIMGLPLCETAQLLNRAGVRF
jgi:septum formation protein